MSNSADIQNMAVFCDFENLAIGAREAKYAKFDIQKVLERLLLKGNIVTRIAYCDWARYRGFKKPMHEAAFELVEVPHVRQSGKNSADIRMVVDALDLCYTKSHIDTFAIVSGDSDFSPLVSKLRENNKFVIGVGVKNSTSDLFINNCDEFIFYDDLVRARPAKKKRAPRKQTKTKSAARTGASNGRSQDEAIETVVETFEALLAERGDQDRIWSSMIKQALKRRKPGFNESFYGYQSFSQLLEDARDAGLIELEREEKSGGYIVKPVS